MGRGSKRVWTHERYQYNKHICAQRDGRIRKDYSLYEDVENYVHKHDTSVDGLVTKLLNNDFGHLRYSDPEYPF